MKILCLFPQVTILFTRWQPAGYLGRKQGCKSVLKIFFIEPQTDFFPPSKWLEEPLRILEICFFTAVSLVKRPTKVFQTLATCVC